jgi:hypothetical protein
MSLTKATQWERPSKRQRDFEANYVPSKKERLINHLEEGQCSVSNEV